MRAFRPGPHWRVPVVVSRPAFALNASATKHLRGLLQPLRKGFHSSDMQGKGWGRWGTTLISSRPKNDPERHMDWATIRFRGFPPAAARGLFRKQLSQRAEQPGIRGLRSGAGGAAGELYAHGGADEHPTSLRDHPVRKTPGQRYISREFGTLAEFLNSAEFSSKSLNSAETLNSAIEQC